MTLKFISPIKFFYRLITIGFIIINLVSCNSSDNVKKIDCRSLSDTTVFTAPDTSTIPHNQFGDMVRYGRELIINTAYYIGPSGTVGKYLGNKMNCTSCHLDAGTRPYGYNFLSTAANYPQYRGRENIVLNIGERINNCIERPHNGKPLPLDSKEIIAMECYMKWLSMGIKVGGHVKGDEPADIELLSRAADPKMGAVIYDKNCASCHGKNGEGLLTQDSSTYVNPPLWGSNSYQRGSSPSRVLKIAAFIKANMPYKIASWQKPFLTDEQATDVAAFINDDEIHPRPQKKDKSTPDYQDLRFKPIDYDKGPYLDTFSEMRHKYGPYKQIIEHQKEIKLLVIY